MLLFSMSSIHTCYPESLFIVNSYGNCVCMLEMMEKVFFFFLPFPLLRHIGLINYFCEVS